MLVTLPGLLIGGDEVAFLADPFSKESKKAMDHEVGEADGEINRLVEEGRLPAPLLSNLGAAKIEMQARMRAGQGYFAWLIAKSVRADLRAKPAAPITITLSIDEDDPKKAPEVVGFEPTRDVRVLH